MQKLTLEQKAILRNALIALPLAYDQHALDLDSVDTIKRTLGVLGDEDARQILDQLRECGVIGPELVPRGGENSGAKPARVRWS
jgi:hypothetical protein